MYVLSGFKELDYVNEKVVRLFLRYGKVSILFLNIENFMIIDWKFYNRGN